MNKQTTKLLMLSGVYWIILQQFMYGRGVGVIAVGLSVATICCIKGKSVLPFVLALGYLAFILN